MFSEPKTATPVIEWRLKGWFKVLYHGEPVSSALRERVSYLGGFLSDHPAVFSPRADQISQRNLVESSGWRV